MGLEMPLVSKRFPRAAKYNPDWVLASVSSAANPLWLSEWLAAAMDLRPGVRVLDLGCGRAASSIFLRQEFGAQVWATDLWFSASEFDRQEAVFSNPLNARANKFGAFSLGGCF
jgi:ubiquinone/menaquinone biosynthesis C-methylase UbiE